MIGRKYEDSYSVRIFLLVGVTVFALGVITLRLFTLQVVSSGYWRGLAENQHQLNQQLIPERGQIFIRDQFSDSLFPIVTNINQPTIYIAPQQVQNASELAATLAGTLGLDRKEVFTKIADQSKKYVPIAKQVAPEAAEKLANQHLPGVYFEEEVHQKYPEGKFAAAVLGFVGYDGDVRSGRYGLEKYFEKELAGTPGSLKGALDSGGNWITGGRDITPAVNGVNLVLTLDRAIQNKAEEVLASTVDQHQALSGSVVVLNPKTGAILAMANYPSFDPNEFSKAEDPKFYNNYAVQSAFEPGSVMKPITFAAALEEGEITPDETYTDPGSLKIENFTIRNSENKVYGEASMTQVLEDSINTGAVYVQQKIGREKFAHYLENFGFGKSTGITLPFETKGSIANIYRGGELYPATMAYGQGMTVSALQIVTAYAAIANGGKLFQPYIVDEIDHHDGRKEKSEPKQLREILSTHTASTLAAMLVSVVEKGHGKRASVPGYFIAGKTGTAQVAYESRSGYDPNRSIGSFVGFGPVNDPVFVMIVKIDEPKDVKFAETTAAPAFGEIAQFILNYYQVPKSR
jgi:cell division protein FtsI/penicillin-binding protein 2